MSARSKVMEGRALRAVEAAKYRFIRDNLVQMHSPDMGGQHCYRFLNSGWLSNQIRGPNFDEAIDAAMKALEEETKKPPASE